MTDAPVHHGSDAEARRRIEHDLETTFFVEAAAGTGKTTALVSRIVSALRTGRATLDRIVAVTFTEKAAGEMKLRLRTEIERCRADRAIDAAERARFETALTHLEIARIVTIHAFCADLLHERPVEAGVDPLFEVAAEDESERLLERAFDAWFEQVLDDPPEGVRRVLRRPSFGRGRGSAADALRYAAGRLVHHRDFDAAWRREPFDREGEIDDVLARLADLAPLAYVAERAKDWVGQNLKKIARFVEENALREAVRGRDHDALEAELRELGGRHVGWHYKGFGDRYGGGLSRAEVMARRDAAKAALDAFTARADADLAACLREDLRPVIDAYEALKKQEGRLDFLDLLLRARNLARDDRGVRESLQHRFTHYFVDEFQDTDPLQVELLLLLAADDLNERDPDRVVPVPGKLFLVGDPKQSIYRFRRADVALYERTKRRLAEAGAEVLQLTTSFRGVPGVQDAVNGAFAPVMTGDDDGAQTDYVPLEPHRPAPERQPSLVALPVPRPYGRYGTIYKNAIQASFPDAVGAFVDWLINESGWTVEEGTARGAAERRVPIEARHVCLLFRRFREFRADATRPYVGALEARRIAHVLVGGHSYHEREEVLAIRNALHAIERPSDRLRVYAALRGPLFALNDDALLAYRHQVGSLHPLFPLDDEARAGLDDGARAVAEAMDVLARLHRGRNRRPIAQTIGRLLAAVRAHAGIAIWPTGEQALANAFRLVDRARRFERRGAASFRAFVDHLEDESDRAQGTDAQLVEDRTDGVRIMTVHKAKGLEFPVVILVDPTRNATHATPSHHVDQMRGLWAEPLCGAAPLDLLDNRPLEARRDEAESVRLAYVAATRARDLLVVPAVGDARPPAERPWWLDTLDPAVYPAPDARRRATEAPGCPAFGDDSVLERPDDARGPGGGPGVPVAPGAHVAQTGNRVVWWDPAALALGAEETIGLRQDVMLQADTGGTVAAEGIRRHEAWREGRERTRERAAVPALVVRSVTALAGEMVEIVRATGGAGGGDGDGGSDGDGGDGGGAAVTVAKVAGRAADRPGGTRFGTLVHAALASVDLHRAPADAAAAAVGPAARLLGAAPDEVEAARACVAGALEHPILARARAVTALGAVRREVPVALRLDDGTLAEGVADLAFREERPGGQARWTVVDFKTDREVGGALALYEAQAALYVRAVKAATGDDAVGVLLVV